MSKKNTTALKCLLIGLLCPLYMFSNVAAQELPPPVGEEEFDLILFPRSFNMDDDFPWGEEVDGKKQVTFMAFEGAALERIENPDKSGLNETDFVLQYERTAGGQPWAGFWYDLVEPMDMDEVHESVYRLKVWSPKEDVMITLKLEGPGFNSGDIHIPIPGGAKEEWVQVEWDLKELDVDEAPYEKIVLFVDFVDADGALLTPGGGPDHTFFLDDFSLVKADDTSSELVGADIPESLQLSQNYPNPFNPTTRIDFALPEAAQVTLEVYNMLGQQVATLENGHLSAGQHSVSFDASDLSSGIYLYRLQAGDQVLTRSLTLVK
ncbi:MAG: T9SS C-terminal target domain-containing protein [Balneolaceae bacterium]|nr:MAG: T9SS C-terminal target domain-containing protein [Balneolaceae bacterium]